jgi:hypothetical protein
MVELVYTVVLETTARKGVKVRILLLVQMPSKHYRLMHQFCKPENRVRILALAQVVIV